MKFVAPIVEVEKFDVMDALTTSGVVETIETVLPIETAEHQ